jgi:8-oxo-dGTP pyrophosphatase MutT (NUDIX family)
LEVEKILGNVEKLLKEGRVVTTVGIFGAIFDKNNKILLHKRVEKDSLIYQQDLSGKWELIGGGVELDDLGEDYQSAIKNTLAREVREETGLEINAEKMDIILLPAVLNRSLIEERNLIDWAFVVPIDAESIITTQEYKRRLETGEIRWFTIVEVKLLEIVSKRMKYLLDIAIHYYQSVKPQNRAKLF